MESKTSKKRTALIASIVAAALLLTGTFAWVLADDQTKLNEFDYDDPGSWNVDLKEEFVEWETKDVWVVNTDTNPVIVRVRFEEFFDLKYRNGTTYDVPLNNGDGDIFIPSANEDGSISYASVTDLNPYIDFVFAENVVTMSEYTAMDDAAKANVTWVIDTDGWCYYTKALSYGETSAKLLDNVAFVDQAAFDKAYDAPYDLNYYVNVRLQAMSADLSSFGSDSDTTQWTNIGTSQDGRFIKATANDKEITTDSTITAEAKALVMSIENPDKTAGKTVSTGADLLSLIKNGSTEKIVLNDNITLTSSQKIEIPDDASLTIDLNEKTLDVSKIITSRYRSHLTIENGNIVSKTTRALDAYDNSVVQLDNVNITSDTNKNSAIYAYGGAVVTLNESSITCTKDTCSGISLVSTASAIVSYSEISAPQYGIHVSTDADKITGNSNVVVDNSTISGDNAAINLVGMIDLAVTNSTLNGGLYGVNTDNTNPAASLAFEGCTINADGIGVLKTDSSDLVMESCNVNVTATDSGAVGICVRDGKVDLDNVKVNVNGESVAVTPHTNDEINAYFKSNSGYDELGFNALQVALNGYGDVNLTINGGSYTTNVTDASSAIVCEESMKSSTAPETFSNSITVTGAPTFSPAFTFADSYTNTTVSK